MAKATIDFEDSTDSIEIQLKLGSEGISFDEATPAQQYAIMIMIKLGDGDFETADAEEYY